jgi:RimJ/RimL family protein N-acetyltransferase
MEQASDFIEMMKNKEFGKAGEWVQYGVESKQSGKIIGDCAVKLNEDDSRIAEIGITISHLHQQQKYAKETLFHILEFLFEKNNILRVVETVDAENTASVSLMRSLGFREEGHFIENLFFKGRWSSEFQFAMLKREWDLIKNTIKL